MAAIEILTTTEMAMADRLTIEGGGRGLCANAAGRRAVVAAAALEMAGMGRSRVVAGRATMAATVSLPRRNSSGAGARWR